MENRGLDGRDEMIRAASQAVDQSPMPLRGSWRPQIGRKAHQILRVHANDTATRTIQIGYEKKRDRYEQRQNKEPRGFAMTPLRSIAQQQIRANGDRSH